MFKQSAKRRRQSKEEATYEETMAENTLELIKTSNPQIQESQRNRINKSNSTIHKNLHRDVYSSSLHKC